MCVKIETGMKFRWTSPMVGTQGYVITSIEDTVMVIMFDGVDYRMSIPDFKRGLISGHLQIIGYDNSFKPICFIKPHRMVIDRRDKDLKWIPKEEWERINPYVESKFFNW